MTTFVDIFYKDGYWTVKDYNTSFSSIEDATDWCYDNIPDCVVNHKIKDKIGDIISLENWKQDCDLNCFIDYDGYGDLVDENFNLIGITRRPSDYTDKRKDFPENAKYILWYNR
jgi:hypothetical protein